MTAILNQSDVIVKRFGDIYLPYQCPGSPQRRRARRELAEKAAPKFNYYNQHARNFSGKNLEPEELRGQAIPTH